MVDVFVKKEFSSDVDTGDMQTEKKQVVRDYIAKGQTCDCPPHDFEELPKKGLLPTNSGRVTSSISSRHLNRSIAEMAGSSCKPALSVSPDSHENA